MAERWPAVSRRIGIPPGPLRPDKHRSFVPKQTVIIQNLFCTSQRHIAKIKIAQLKIVVFSTITSFLGGRALASVFQASLGTHPATPDPTTTALLYQNKQLSSKTCFFTSQRYIAKIINRCLALWAVSQKTCDNTRKTVIDIWASVSQKTCDNTRKTVIDIWASVSVKTCDSF